MMNNHQAPSLPQYYYRTALGSVLETRCRAAIDAFEGLQIRNAIALLASAKERAIKAASNAVEHAFRFSSTPPPPAPSLITNDAPVPADGSFVDHLNYGSYRVWNTQTCRPKQEEAVETICFSEVCGGKLLVIDRTGSGKSHILRMVATFVGGVILVIVPLLVRKGLSYKNNYSFMIIKHLCLPNDAIYFIVVVRWRVLLFWLFMCYSRVHRMRASHIILFCQFLTEVVSMKVVIIILDTSFLFYVVVSFVQEKETATIMA